MPRWGSESDSTTASVIERWKQTADYEVDDIRRWREDPGERIYYSGAPTCEWGEMPNGFYSRTAYLIGCITTHYPKLDPTPLQDIYIAVLAWHEDHNAKRIPPQPVLFATLERAMLVVNAVEMDIHSCITKDSSNLSDSFDVSDEKESAETPVTLKEFMKQYCEPLRGAKLYGSKVKSLQREARRHKAHITLPEPINTPGRGRTNYYLPPALKEAWPSYCQILSYLPKLKV